MSRKSQSFWEHQIDGNVAMSDTDVRYSLTFRYVSMKFLRSTIIVGDSNTRCMNFGEGKGTFGHLIPGRRVEAIHIEDIKPIDCCGYKNILIHCGINNIKHHRVNTRDAIHTCFVNLKNKVEEIRKLCPSSRLVLCPVLPTKRSDWTNRACCFNGFLFEYANRSNGKITTMNAGGFCNNNSGLLADELGLYWKPDDPLHLGSRGIRVLANMIRHCVYGSATTGRSYSSVLVGNTEGRSSGGVAAGVTNGHQSYRRYHHE